MRVYRIEDRSDAGPWSGIDHLINTYVENGGGEDHGDISKHPNPYNDGIDCRGVCGVVSLDQLKHWFSSETGRDAMQQAGGKLKVFELEPDCEHEVGNFQVVFDRERAKHVETLDLVTLETIQ